jgi:Virus neck protein
MATGLTNHYFNNYKDQSEQRLIEDLIVESIKIMGFQAYYIPIQNPEDRDILFGEDPLKKFTSAYPIEMYLSTTSQYEGERDFFSKFGLEIRNEVSVIVSKRSFTQRIPSDIIRPREGDLVYIPVINGVGNLMEITFTDHTKDFFMLGRKVPYFYELKMEQYRFSQDYINTGIPDIDSVVQDAAYTVELNMYTGTGNYQQKEIVFQSNDSTLANAFTQASVQSWNSPEKKLYVTYIKGEFIDEIPVIGSTSGASYTLSSYNPNDVVVKNDSYDNNFINVQGDLISDFNESNPFGSL